jgi:hypothetical protein
MLLSCFDSYLAQAARSSLRRSNRCRLYASSTFQDRSRRPRHLRSQARKPLDRPPTPLNEEQHTFLDEVALRPRDDSYGHLEDLVSNEKLVISRQIEMLNIFVGFEQSNKYVIHNEEGHTLGFIAEEPRGILSM